MDFAGRSVFFVIETGIENLKNGRCKTTKRYVGLTIQIIESWKAKQNLLQGEHNEKPNQQTTNN